MEANRGNQTKGIKMKATAQDLWVGAKWLEWALDDYFSSATFDVQDDHDAKRVKQVQRCIEYLKAESDRREKRTALAAAKREYAAAHGIKVSQVRVGKKAVA